MRDVALIRGDDPRAVGEATRRATSLLSAGAAPSRDRTERVIESWTSPDGSMALVQSESIAAPVRVPLHRTRSEAFAYTGFVGLPDPSATSVRERVVLRNRWLRTPALVLREAPGGTAAFFLADGDGRAAYAWSGLSGAEGVFHAQGPRVTVISNRPLCAHLVATERDRPSFSRTWARRILVGDYTLWDDTPYDDTFYAPPRSTVVVDRRGIRFLPHPLRIPSSSYAAGSTEAIDDLVHASLDAIGVVRRMPRGELHLSGGKDSRMVAALVKRAGIDVETVTYGGGVGGESAAAAAVARCLGLPHRVAAQDTRSDESLLPTMLANLARAEGLLNENRQLSYAPPPVVPGRPVLEGQAHHPRGGYKTHEDWGVAKARARLHRQLGGDGELVASELGAERRRRIDALVVRYRPRRAAELAFWMYADWRAARWLHAAYLANTAERHVVWPMMDERVLSVCARLDVADRVREVAFFRALTALAPELARLPLYEDVWKFDHGGPGSTPFPDGFAERTTPFPEQAATRRRGRVSPEKRLSTIAPLFRMAMSDLACSAEVRSWIRPEALPLLLAGDDRTAALGLENQQIVRFLWKATAIALVLDGAWLDRAPSEPAAAAATG